tara:strand:- start:339 stop:476 length:138 start_codon:yes stop_codon:yes gene_type:complete
MFGYLRAPLRPPDPVVTKGEIEKIEEFLRLATRARLRRYLKGIKA